MSFDIYKNKFSIEAKNNGFPDDIIEKCLIYAENLFNNNLPVIYNLTHLSFLIGIKRNYISQAAVVSKYSEAYYRYYKVPKKNGKGYRLINEPLPNLKTIQYWILKNILEKSKPSNYSKAYAKKSNIKNNVRFHKNQKLVCSFDIKDFFQNITFTKVELLFVSLGYTQYISKYLAKLCCLKECLPQGAPTSPAISNLIMKNFDNEVSSFCKLNKIRYTRYADDLTFSGDFNPQTVKEFIEDKLNKYGFNLNEKTKVMYDNSRQIVTGIVVNNVLQLPKEYRREIRKEMYYIKKYGLKNHMIYSNIQNKNYLNHLIGKINYCIFINKEDLELKEYLKYLKKYLKK